MKNVKPNKKNKVNPRSLIAYSIGSIADYYSVQSINWLVMIVYNVILGVNPVLVGGILAVSRLWDAFTDTFVGCYSDNLRSQKGRRRPLLLAGSIGTGISLWIIWHVPDHASTNTAAWYLGVSIVLFYIFYTLYSVSYESLGIELTSDYMQINRVFALRDCIKNTMGLGLPWLPALIYSDIFPTPAIGVRTVGTVISVLVVVAGVFALSCRETYQSLAMTQPKLSLVRSISLVFSSREMFSVVLMGAINLVGIFFSGTLGFYINTYYLAAGNFEKGTVLSGVAGTSSLVGSIIASLLVFKFFRRVERASCLRWALILLCISTLLSWFFYQPNSPYLLIVAHPVTGFANTMFWIALMGARSDACLLQEYRSEFRIEGAISGVMSWLCKMGMSFGIFAASMVLGWLGVKDNAEEAFANESALLMLKIIFICFPFVCYVLCFLFSLLYNLTENRCRNITVLLEARRGVA